MGGVNHFKTFANSLEIELPNDTVYTIDKVVRDRLRKGRFGVDFSEYIGIEKDEEHKMHFYHHEMLRLGKTSIEIPYVPWSEQLKDRLAKSPILPENRRIKNPSKFKTIREPKKGKRAQTAKKYGSWRKGNGTAKEDYSDWRMRKRAADRMREKLISQAKDEVRKNIYLDMVEAYHAIIKAQQQTEHHQNTPDHAASSGTAAANAKPSSRAIDPQGEGDDEELKNMRYKNFKEFWYKTRQAIYPNPMF